MEIGKPLPPYIRRFWWLPLCVILIYARCNFVWRGVAHKLPDNGACRVLPMTRAWTIPGDPFPPSPYLEFRKAERGFLAVALRDGFERSTTSLYSREKPVFNPLTGKVVRSFSDSEWQNASFVSCSNHDVSGFDVSDADRGRTRFDARAYGYSGEHLQDSPYSVLLSPDGRWISVQSFDGALPDNSPLHQHIDHGTVYFDIYRTTTRKKNFQLRGRYLGESDGIAQLTCWLPPETLVAPVNEEQTAIVLCTPRN